MIYLGENLRTIRLFEEKSQEEFAKKLGVSRASLSQYEGSISEPTIKTIIRFSQTLGLTIEQLVFRELDKKFLETKNKTISQEQRAKTIEWLNRGNRI